MISDLSQCKAVFAVQVVSLAWTVFFWHQSLVHFFGTAPSARLSRRLRI